MNNKSDQSISINKDSTKEEVLKAIKKNPYHLLYANEIYKKDKEVIKAALKNDGRALEYVSNEIKNDEDIIFASITSSKNPNKLENDLLKKNKSFIKKALKNNPYVLLDADKSLKEDKELIQLSINYSFGEILDHLDSDYKNNIQIILDILKLRIIKKKPLDKIYEIINKSLFENNNFISEVLKLDKNINPLSLIVYLDHETLQNKKIISFYGYADTKLLEKDILEYYYNIYKDNKFNLAPISGSASVKNLIFSNKEYALKIINSVPKNKNWLKTINNNILSFLNVSLYEDENFLSTIFKIPYELSDLWIVSDYKSQKRYLSLDRDFGSFYQSYAYTDLIEKEDYDERFSDFFFGIYNHIEEHVNKFQGMIQWDVLMSHFIINSIAEVYFKIYEANEDQYSTLSHHSTQQSINELNFYKNYKDYFIIGNFGISLISNPRRFRKVKMSEFCDLVKQFMSTCMTHLCDYFGEFKFTDKYNISSTNLEIKTNNETINKIFEKYLSSNGVSWPDKSNYEEYLNLWEQAFKDSLMKKEYKKLEIMLKSLENVLISDDFQKRKTNKLSHEDYEKKLKTTTIFRANSNKILLPNLN